MIKAEVQMDALDKRPVIAAAPGGGRTEGRLSLGPKPPPLGKPPLTYTLSYVCRFALSNTGTGGTGRGKL